MTDTKRCACIEGTVLPRYKIWIESGEYFQCDRLGYWHARRCVTGNLSYVSALCLDDHCRGCESNCNGGDCGGDRGDGGASGGGGNENNGDGGSGGSRGDGSSGVGDCKCDCKKCCNGSGDGGSGGGGDNGKKTVCSPGKFEVNPKNKNEYKVCKNDGSGWTQQKCSYELDVFDVKKEKCICLTTSPTRSVDSSDRQFLHCDSTSNEWVVRYCDALEIFDATTKNCVCRMGARKIVGKKQAGRKFMECDKNHKWQHHQTKSTYLPPNGTIVCARFVPHCLIVNRI